MLSLRDAAAADLAALIALDAIAQREPARVETLRAAMTRGGCVVAERDGEIAGYAVLGHSFFGHCFLELVVVREGARRSGVGRALVREAVARCRTPKLFTSTNASNVAMQALLAMQGFVRSGVIENLDPGDLELVYVRSLANDRPASPATELAPRGATGERASFEAGLAREIRALEERLLDPTHRADPRAVSALLEDEFVELGASGRRWTKSTFLAALTADGASSGRLADFSLRLLASDVALATYRIQVSTNAPGPAGARGSLRSSIWRRAPGGAWRLLFHQGTPTGAHP